MRRTASLVLVAMVALCACNGGVDHRVSRVEHRTFAVPSGDHTDLVIKTFNGDVTVTAIGLGTADVTVTPHGTGLSQADAQAALDSVAVSYGKDGTTLTVTAKASADAPLGASHGADVDVALPADTSASVTSSNGHVEVVNISGAIGVQTSNGSVTTRGGTGIVVGTSNGAVSLTAPSGPTTVSTSNASVDILDARSVVAQVQTGNGAISFSGSLGAGPQSFTTANASLTLRLPSDQGFSLDASTSNANVNTDFPGITARQGTLQGSVGDGSAQISAHTSNGQLEVLELRP